MWGPRLVVCLGVPAAKLLAALTPEAAPWRPWPGYVELGRRADRASTGCAVAGVASLPWLSITRQPLCLSAIERRRDAEIIAVAARRPGSS